MRRIAIPERGISGLSLLADEKKLLVAAKNGRKVLLFETDEGFSWRKQPLDVYCRDSVVPVVWRNGDGECLFASRNYTPYVLDINRRFSKEIRSPFFKRAVVTGQPVSVESGYLVPVCGVPYGCRLVSPGVMFSENGKDYRFRSFISISEDFGMVFGSAKLAKLQDNVVAVVESTFPYRLIFTSLSRDGGKSWSRLRFTGISGLYSVVCPVGDRLVLLCYDRDTSCIKAYDSRDGERWRLISSWPVEQELSHMEASASSRELVLGVAYSSGEAEVVQLAV